jgi:GNAT superfamily N-acetyltransferase
MIIRQATKDDIENYMIVRMAVKENVLNTPELVTKEGEERILTVDGKGWVCEIASKIVGFVIVDLKRHILWALFVHPDFENRGIGKELHKIMLEYYFSQSQDRICLTTEPNTRADQFYQLAGWNNDGMVGKEKKYSLSYDSYKKLYNASR